MNKLNSHS